MIKIIDYGVGNIRAFLTLFKRLNIPVELATTNNQILSASKLILPGVGAFDHAMQSLNNSGMRPGIEEMVLNQEIPLLGICVGMQMLATESEEGSLPGLNFIPGKVISFKNNSSSSSLPSPHMGWNDVNFVNKLNGIGKDFETSSRFYFLHSYYYEVQNKEHISAISDYGFLFEAAINKKNIYGAQFHPEKSHKWGAKLINNFVEI